MARASARPWGRLQRTAGDDATPVADRELIHAAAGWPGTRTSPSAALSSTSRPWSRPRRTAGSWGRRQARSGPEKERARACADAARRRRHCRMSRPRRSEWRCQHCDSPSAKVVPARRVTDRGEGPRPSHAPGRGRRDRRLVVEAAQPAAHRRLRPQAGERLSSTALHPEWRRPCLKLVAAGSRAVRRGRPVSPPAPRAAKSWSSPTGLARPIQAPCGPLRKTRPRSQPSTAQARSTDR